MTPNHAPSRRSLLRRASAFAVGGGLGLYRQLSIAAALGAGHPLAPRPGHHTPKAKHLIVFFMTGGFSHLDTFDYKPLLQRDHDKPNAGRKLLGSPWKFRPRGGCGKMVSTLFEHMGGVVDDICFLHTIHGDSGGHSAATLGMHTGSVTIPLPSLGAWVSYGLGTENINLPSFVVLAAKEPYNGFQVWDSNFLPAYHKGVRVIPGANPMPDVASPIASVSRRELESQMLRDLNSAHLEARDADAALASRTTTFDTAYGLMHEAPEAFSLKGESPQTLALYGADAANPSSFAAQCLTARRLIERGVRVVELFDVGSNTNWDSHNDINDHDKLSKNIDQPIAALITDLKQRGLLDETLIVGCSEFGRTPWQDLTPKGRGHHSSCFTCFLAGGGTKGGFSYGVSDDYGATPAENPVHVHDFHATILHLLGLDHTKLTYRYSGRDYRLTDIYGEVVRDIIA